MLFRSQGDQNIQRAIIKQLKQEGCEVLVPIGTTTSQMTLNLAKEKKVICLAADTSLVPSFAKVSATVLDDALSVKESLSFLRAAFPEVRKVSVVFSSSEKVAKEVEAIEEVAKTLGIKVEKMLVHTMPELYTISSFIAQDSEAIFILKDHLVVSGITTLMQQAEKRGIFVMTSDEGSVSLGGSFAIGIKERVIGKEGATLAKTILQGVDPQEIPSKTIEGPFSLFINRSSCSKQGIDLLALEQAAKQFALRVEYVQEEG